MSTPDPDRRLHDDLRALLASTTPSPPLVDLRSDTVTRPDAAMRAAIATAPVGDDVFDDDPTVHALQDRVADLFGHEAALFVPSGTMANQISLLVHTRPGDHVVVPTGAHLVHYEAGAGAAWAGVMFEELGAAGRYDLDELASAAHPDDPHCAPTALVTLENTHNASGGRVVPTEHVEAVRAVTETLQVPLHLDGARVWNAIAAGQDPRRIGAAVDSLNVCLSKGLGAPVGSLFVGSRRLVADALRRRKMLGGAMRQVGLLAAAGLHALDHHLPTLGDDHRRARVLATGLAAIDGVTVDLASVETNMVYFELDADLGVDGATFARRTAEHGVLGYATAPRTVRWVTHRDVDDEGIERAIAAARAAVGAPG